LQDFSGNGLNTLPDQYLSLGNSLFESLPNPFFGVLPANSSLGASPTITREQLLLPYPQFTSVAEQSSHRASSSYNGFQLKAQKRMSQGLSMLLSYTTSKLIDDASASDGPNAYTVGHQDFNNLRLDRSVSALERSQVFHLSFNYELPFGTGKPL